MHFDNIMCQISNDGLDTWEPVPTKGPFGFNAALMLDGTQVTTVCVKFCSSNELSNALRKGRL